MNAQVAKKPVAIPQNIANIVKFETLSMDYFPDYIEGGADISFYKPKPGEKLLLSEAINEPPVTFKKAKFVR